MKFNEVFKPYQSNRFYRKKKEEFLGEGITHIEDAEVKEFINTVANLSKMIVSEKLDGANMVFGLDDKGKFYSGRGGHKGGGERFRRPSDWVNAMGGKNAFAPNGFASAHQALNRFKKNIEATLQPGETVEAEILFGTIPNAVAYDGKNYIALLRMVNGPVKRLKEMEKAFKGKKTVVLSNLLTTGDGITIKRQTQKVEWNFTTTSFIDSFNLKKVNVQEQLSKLNAFIRLPAKGFPEFNNCEVLTIPLTMVPKEKRAAFKKLREKVEDQVQTKFKLPIKEELLNQLVRKLGPKLGAKADDGGWIEGVVILDPATKRQLKIVDKDVFTAINNFNWEIRAAVGAKAKGANQLNVSTMGKYTQGLGKIFGIPNLFITAQSGRILKKLGGKNAEQTLERLVGSLPKGQDLSTYKGPLDKLTDQTIKALDKMLNKYRKERDTRALKIDSGPIKKTVGFNEDIDKRTLQVFAESRAELMRLKETAKTAKSTGEVLAVLLHNKLRNLK